MSDVHREPKRKRIEKEALGRDDGECPEGIRNVIRRMIISSTQARGHEKTCCKQGDCNICGVLY